MRWIFLARCTWWYTLLPHVNLLLSLTRHTNYCLHFVRWTNWSNGGSNHISTQPSRLYVALCLKRSRFCLVVRQMVLSPSTILDGMDATLKFAEMAPSWSLVLPCHASSFASKEWRHKCQEVALVPKALIVELHKTSLLGATSLVESNPILKWNNSGFKSRYPMSSSNHFHTHLAIVHYLDPVDDLINFTLLI